MSRLAKSKVKRRNLKPKSENNPKKECQSRCCSVSKDKNEMEIVFRCSMKNIRTESGGKRSVKPKGIELESMS